MTKHTCFYECPACAAEKKELVEERESLARDLAAHMREMHDNNVKYNELLAQAGAEVERLQAVIQQTLNLAGYGTNGVLPPGDLAILHKIALEHLVHNRNAK